MGVAILSIGTELTRGEIVDTNSAWLAATLTEAGFEITACHTVGDDAERIVALLQRVGAEHRVVIVTGGLGPTSDDLTSLCAARAAGTELVRNDEALAAIRRRVESRGRSVTPLHEKQADIPRGAELLPNADGTAPGYSLHIGGASAFFLPGVPREMKRMFAEQVLPRLRPEAPNDSFVVRLRTFGLPESAAAQLLEGLDTADVTLGYRVHFPELDVKIQARASSLVEARSHAHEVAAKVRDLLGDAVYGEGDDSLPSITGRALRAKGWRLALAESCTGGLISHLLTSFPGASDFLVGAAVTYANSAKTRLLGVSEDTLRGHGAVSAEVAAEMAQGARRLCEVDVGLAVTGIAGPAGGTATKPVGLVYWAVAHPGGTVVRERVFPGDRNEIQLHAAYSALDLARRVAAGLPLGAEPPTSQRAPAR
ncbi:MAG TPA: competence/damage-inducible protein A [Polyangiaceae bacterium]|jgi:nicotinamide-nucleotide amidase|nr:competence/damage-inducible protein A [Polyangiaceae bacterium]